MPAVCRAQHADRNRQIWEPRATYLNRGPRKAGCPHICAGAPNRNAGDQAYRGGDVPALDDPECGGNEDRRVHQYQEERPEGVRPLDRAYTLSRVRAQSYVRDFLPSGRIGHLCPAVGTVRERPFPLHRQPTLNPETGSICAHPSHPTMRKYSQCHTPTPARRLPCTS